MKESNEWNATNYNNHADFVSKLAMPVVELLDPKDGEYILDVGCGEGSLAVEIEKFGANVLAIDLSEDMVEKTKQKGIAAYVMSATNIEYEDKFDAIFSNATLHWVLDPKLALEQFYKALKDDGRFVAEFGGEGNIKALISAIKRVFNNHPEFGEFNNPWYFPSIKTYKNIVEEVGFKVESMESIKRDTKIDDISNWLDIFANGIIKDLNKRAQDVFKKEVRDILKPILYTDEKGWVVDYVRLRFKAVKLDK